MFGERIAQAVDRGFLELAKEYASSNGAWYLLAQKQSRTRRKTGTRTNLETLKRRLPATKVDLSPSASKLAEYLFDLDEQRLLVDWITSRREADLNITDEQTTGHFAKYMHDSIFVHGYALIDKASGVVTNSLVNYWGDRLSRPKAQVKGEFKTKYDLITGNIANLRHSFLHGQGGPEGPDPSFLTEKGWWKYILVAGAWPPRQPINFRRYADQLDEWMEKFRPAAEGTADEVGGLLSDLMDELNVSPIGSNKSN